MRRWFRFSVRTAIFAACISSTASFAGLVEITHWPHPLVYGNNITYTAIHSDPDYEVDHYVWEYTSPCASNWITAPGTGQSIIFHENRVGVWYIKVTAHYKSVPDPNLTPNPPNPSPITRSVTIPKPDGFRIVAGVGVPAAPTEVSPVIMKFRLTSGGNDSGPYVSGLAQERLPNPDPEVGWVPEQAEEKFHLQFGGIIYDEHRSVWPPADWAAVPIGPYGQATTIELRIIASDPCGDPVKCHLGSYTYQRRKVDADHWQNDVTGTAPPPP